MIYTCSVCQQKMDGDIIKFKNHTENHIIDLVKHDHPEWVNENGLCPQCADYYRTEMNGSVFKDVPCVLRNRKIKSFWNRIKTIFR